MSWIFDFADGGEKSYLDARSGKTPAVWERKELQYALGKYEAVHGKTKMLSMVRQITGAAAPSNIPTYMFGRVIAYVAIEISLRPYRTSVMKAIVPPAREMRRLAHIKRKFPDGDEFA